MTDKQLKKEILDFYERIYETIYDRVAYVSPEERDFFVQSIASLPKETLKADPALCYLGLVFIFDSYILANA